MNETYARVEPSRADVDAIEGPAVIEFGTAWCGHCRHAQPLIARAFARHSGVRHVKVEDGSGRPLGRSFGVRLWPTLVFLREGKELAKLVRPDESAQIKEALAQIDG